MEERPGSTLTPLVLIIHGTWNSPGESGLEASPWYRLDDTHDGSFIRRLNDRLEAAGCGRPVSAVIPGKSNGFAWSGANKHEERLDAAEKLEKELRALTADTRRPVHLIAHSHGGNVVMSAIEKLRSTAKRRARREAEEVLRNAVAKVEAGMEPGDAAGRALHGYHDLPETVQPLIERALESVRRTHSRPVALRLPCGATTFLRRYAVTFRRNERKFREAFTEARSSTGIGRVVFLGTPFYYKKWTIRHFVRKRAVDWMFRTLGTLAVSIPFSLWTAYVIIVVYGGLLALTPWVTFAGWNPFEWPVWTQVLGGLIAAPFAFIWVQQFIQESGRSDGNLYDTGDADEKIAWPIDALVVHAGLMDEALLALSAEPIVLSFLLPPLKELLSPELWRAMSPPGTRLGSSPGNAARRFLTWVWVQSSNLVLLPLWPIRKVIAGILERYTTGMILKLASAGGFGLPAVEMANAHVEASPFLRNVPQYHTVHWDVSQVLSAEPATEPTATQAWDRFSFLWDDEELERRSRNSFTWQRVAQRQQDVFRRILAEGSEQDVRRLKMTCVMVDVRAREFAGAVELAHSTYYSNKTVIEGVARFLFGEPGSLERRCGAAWSGGNDDPRRHRLERCL